MKYLVLAREAIKQPLPKGDAFDVSTLSDVWTRSHQGVIVDVPNKEIKALAEEVRKAEMTVHVLDKTPVDEWLKNHGLVIMEK